VPRVEEFKQGSPKFKSSILSTVDDIGGWCQEGGTVESIRVERQGIPGNPVSGKHHPALSHYMKIQWKRIDTYHEGRGRVGQKSKKASKCENAIDCTEPRCVTETSTVQRSISLTFQMPHSGDDHHGEDHCLHCLDFR